MIAAWVGRKTRSSITGAGARESSRSSRPSRWSARSICRWRTRPGVAEPCLEIAADEDKSWEYTARGNLVAVISNGTAVLGLGNIGAAAGKPVMEGKACLFKKFADIDVFDLEIAENDVDKFVDIVAALEPTFGGINLEDIAAPACFEIEAEAARAHAHPGVPRRPARHRDHLGRRAAQRRASSPASSSPTCKLVVSGAGAGAIACVEFFCSLGVEGPGTSRWSTPRASSTTAAPTSTATRQQFAIPDDGRRTLADAMKGADMFMGLSVAGHGHARDAEDAWPTRRSSSRWRTPIPRFGYPEAMAARPDALVATGRSDYPNQVNNVLGFPYIFRGALDCRASRGHRGDEARRGRTPLAELTREPVPDAVVGAYGGKTIKLGPDYLIPKPFDPRALWWVAPAVAKAAMESGVARIQFDIDEYREHLMSKGSNAAYSIMRTIGREARREPEAHRLPARRERRACCARSSRSSTRASPSRSCSAVRTRSSRCARRCRSTACAAASRSIDPRTEQHASATPSGSTSCASARA